MEAKLFICFILPLLTLFSLAYCQSLGAEDYAVGIRFIVKRNDKYELLFTCISNLQNTEGYQLHLLLETDDDEVLDQVAQSKLTEERQWVWKYKSPLLEPGQVIRYKLQILQNGIWLESTSHKGELPQQPETVETEESDKPVEVTVTTAEQTQTTHKPAVYEITKRTTSPTATPSDSEENRRRRRPPPRAEQEVDINLTLIIVCTVVPIVVMGGIVLIVLIVIKYRRRQSRALPPPYEPPGQGNYGGSTIGSHTSQGNLLREMQPARAYNPRKAKQENSYTVDGEIYEEISDNQNVKSSSPSPNTMKPTFARQEQPMSDGYSVYIDPEVGLPEANAPLSPRSQNYERPLPCKPDEDESRVYLSLSNEYCDTIE